MTDTSATQLLNNLVQLQLYYCESEDTQCHVEFNQADGFLLLGNAQQSADFLHTVFGAYPIYLGETYEKANAWISNHFANQISAYRESQAARNG